MIYVALLRGINVGGKNKIKMAALKLAFESLGFQRVVTYLHSGNIIFETKSASKAKLTRKIETMIQSDFDLNIPVLIRELDEMARVIKALPETWQNDSKMKSDVIFLWEAVKEDEMLAQLKPNSTIDTVITIPGAILWMVDRSHVNQSRLKQLVGQPLYQKVTIRNVNTTRKIFDLMKNLSE